MYRQKYNELFVSEMLDMSFRILLIDNDKQTSLNLSNMIGDEQTIITIALTIVDSMKLLSNNQYELILLDLDKDGVKLFENIFKFGIPIIVMANYDNEDLAISMLRRGAQDYLVKNGVLNKRGLRRVIMHTVERSAFVKNNTRSMFDQDLVEARRTLKEHNRKIRASISEIGAVNATFAKYRNKEYVKGLLR